MKLILSFDGNIEETIMYYSNEVVITTFSYERVKQLLSDNNLKEENIEYRKTSLEYISELDDEFGFDEKSEHLNTIKFIKKAIDKSFVLSDFNHVNIKLGENENLFNYKIFLEQINSTLIIDASNFSKENINYLKNINFQNEPQIKYDLNNDLNTLSEFIETMDIIDNIKTMINKYSLSKVEQQMLLYDLIRKRLFKKGDEEDYAASRDLNRVLKEEEIVCAGYANIFAAVSNYLGIPTFVKIYLPTKGKVGHATNVSYFYDELYDEHFTLEYDATWDSRKNSKDKDWINNYKFFGQSENLAAHIKIQNNLKVNSSLLEELKQAYERYIYFIENGNIPYVVNNSVKRILDLVIDIYNYLEDNVKVNYLEKFKSDIKDDIKIDKEIVDKIYRDILNIHKKGMSLTTFLKVLYRVRRIEHSIDPIEYPLDYKLLEKICSDKYTQDKLLLKLLVNKNVIEELEVLNYVPSKVKDKIKYDTAMMKFLHQLRRISEEKEKSLTNK